MRNFFVWLIFYFPGFLAFRHDETRDGLTIQKPFWPRTHLAEMKLGAAEAEKGLKFGSLDLLPFLANFSANGTDGMCIELLRSNLNIYVDLLKNISLDNDTILSDKDLDIVTSFGSWGSDVKYALWTLDHWNWVSNDMQCKLAHFYAKNEEKEKTQYCAYEIETGDDIKRNLVVGYCLPDTCTGQVAEDIGKRLSEAVPQYWSEIDRNRTEEKRWVDCVLSYQTVDWYTRPQTWVVIVVFLILVLLAVVASILQFG